MRKRTAPANVNWRRHFGESKGSTDKPKCSIRKFCRSTTSAFFEFRISKMVLEETAVSRV